MAIDQNELIDDLVLALKPTKAQWIPLHRTLVWFPFVFICTLLVTSLIQDFRPGFWTQVISYPRFLIELVSAIALSILAVFLSFVHFGPGEKASSTIIMVFKIMGVVFLASFFWSFFVTTPDTSAVGMRPFCDVEVIVYGTLALTGFLFLNRKGLLELRPSKRLLYGASVGLIPALVMQVACMYEPSHALIFHFLPVVVVAFIGVFLSKMILR